MPRAVDAPNSIVEGERGRARKTCNGENNGPATSSAVVVGRCARVREHDESLDATDGGARNLEETENGLPNVAGVGCVYKLSVEVRERREENKHRVTRDATRTQPAEIVHTWRTERKIFVESPFHADVTLRRTRGVRREEFMEERSGSDRKQDGSILRRVGVFLWRF